MRSKPLLNQSSRKKQEARQSTLETSPPRTGGAARSTILREATRLFSQRGFDGVSIKDISTAANANIAAVNYYFRDKEGLYREIIESFGKSGLMGAKSALSKPQTHKELRTGICSFLEETLASAAHNLDAVVIVQREFEMVSARADDIFRSTFLTLFQVMVDFLTAAKSKKLLRREVEAEFAAAFLFNHLSHALRMDRVSEAYFGRSLKDETYRKEWIRSTCELFSHSIEDQS